MNDNNDLKIVYLYRHGETDWNVEDRTMGQLEKIDTKFTDIGYEQIYEISEELEKKEIEVIYSSDFKRTIETAKIANIKNNLPIFITKEVRGLNMGKYQGLILSDFINSEDVINSFKNHNIPLEGGESINQLNTRLLNFIKKICLETKYKKIAIITHSAAISNLRAFILKDDYIRINKCTLLYENNDISVLDYTFVDKGKTKNLLLTNNKNQ